MDRARLATILLTLSACQADNDPAEYDTGAAVDDLQPGVLSLLADPCDPVEGQPTALYMGEDGVGYLDCPRADDAEQYRHGGAFLRTADWGETWEPLDLQDSQGDRVHVVASSIALDNSGRLSICESIAYTESEEGDGTKLTGLLRVEDGVATALGTVHGCEHIAVDADGRIMTEATNGTGYMVSSTDGLEWTRSDVDGIHPSSELEGVDVDELRAEPGVLAAARGTFNGVVANHQDGMHAMRQATDVGGEPWQVHLSPIFHEEEVFTSFETAIIGPSGWYVPSLTSQDDEVLTVYAGPSTPVLALEPRRAWSCSALAVWAACTKGSPCHPPTPAAPGPRSTSTASASTPSRPWLPQRTGTG